uniref:Uncharacterized protein n=1 Tax=Oryctolagus cuniculus TaxID=9986 RepID=A0A5F9CSL6_RABIT
MVWLGALEKSLDFGLRDPTLSNAARVRPGEGARAHAQRGGHCHARAGSAPGPGADWFRQASGGCSQPGSLRLRVAARGTRAGRARLQPSRMEVLDEFDREFPQSVTFCQLISEEDFERQAATYTERALRRLFRSLDRNPALAERVVRKGKQTECERRGLLSFLWAKFSSAVQGELNQCNSMGALEMHQRLEQLKRSIHRVHLYSRDARKKKKKPKPKKPERILSRDRSTSPCQPPHLLPPLLPPATNMASVVASSPPVYTMPRVFGPFPPLPSKSVSVTATPSIPAFLGRTPVSPPNPPIFRLSWACRCGVCRLSLGWNSNRSSHRGLLGVGWEAQSFAFLASSMQMPGARAKGFWEVPQDRGQMWVPPRSPMRVTPTLPPACTSRLPHTTCASRRPPPGSLPCPDPILSTWSWAQSTWTG